MYSVVECFGRVRVDVGCDDPLRQMVGMTTTPSGFPLASTAALRSPLQDEENVCFAGSF